MTWMPGSKWKKENKYANKKTQVAGHWFDSKLEAAVFHRLSLEERGGGIRDLAHQPGTIFLSAARIQYRPDFRFIRSDTGKTEFAEAKGFQTTEWRIKRKLWISYGPGILYIYGGSATRLTLMEILEPQTNLEIEE